MPGLPALAGRLRSGRGRKASARYLYGVWLRHLAELGESGVKPKFGAVMEIGPGDSLGVGLAALLSGAERYIAVDWVAHTDVADNLRVFDELAALFAARASIPGDEGFPRPVAANGVGCSPERVRRIREFLAAGACGACPPVTYVAPYRIGDLPEENFADFVVSHAVMEHVDEAESLYAAIFRWLRPGGSASFVIDYRCHRTSSRWNGHWAYSDREWSRIRADRPYSLNRLPHSEHMRLLAKCGYRIDREKRSRTPSEIDRRELSPRFANLTPDDLETSGSRVLASRPGA